MYPLKTATASQLDMRMKHFFCVMPDTEQTITDFQKRCTVGVSVKAMDDREYLDEEMIMLDKGIFYGYMQVSQVNLQNIGQIKYIYKRMNIKKSSWLESDKVVKLSRPRNFIQLDYFFDFLQPRKIILDKVETQRQTQRLIALLVSRFKEKNNVSALIGFIEFSQIEQIRYPIIDWIFENLLSQYHNQEKVVPIVLDQIQAYIIEVISAFEIQQLISHRDRVQELLGLFMFHELGYFRNLFPPNIPQRIQKGLSNLVTFCSKIGLEFLDFSLVVPNQNQYLSFLLSEEQNHAYVLSSLQTCIIEFSFKDSTIIAIGVNLINSAATLKNVFNYYMTVCGYLKEQHNAEVTQAFARKAMQFSNLKIKALIDQQIELMVTNEQMIIMYGTMIKASVIECLKGDTMQSRLTFKGIINGAAEGGRLIDLEYMNQIIGCEIHVQFQKQIPKIVNAWFEKQGERACLKDYLEVCSINLKKLLNQNSKQQIKLNECLEILEQQISQLVPSNSLNLSAKFDPLLVIEALSTTLVDHLLQFKFNHSTFLDELQSFLQPDISAEMVSCSVSIGLQLLQDVAITSDFLRILIKSLYNSSLLLKNENLYPIAVRALELWELDQNNLPPLVELLDRSIFLTCLKIANNVPNEKSKFLAYIRSLISQLIDSICDGSLKMKVLMEIKSKKPRKINEVIKYLRPEFDTQNLLKLENIQQIYLLNMEKCAQFLSQTVKTEFFEASLSLQNQLKEIQSRYNYIEIKEIETRSLWSAFNNFKTIDMFFHFKDSKVLDNIIASELKNNNFNSIFQGDAKEYYSNITNFDEFCQTQIFNKIALEHFQNILSYPKTQLLFEKLGKYWRGITKDNILIEIRLIELYMHQYHNNEQKPSEQLINDLNEFSQLPIRIKNASILINIEAFILYNLDETLNKDRYYTSLQQLVGFGNSVSSTLELRELNIQIQNLQNLMKEIENNRNIDLQVIKVLSEVRDLFKLYLLSNGYNIQDLLEAIENNSGVHKTQNFEQIISHIFHVFTQIEKSQKLQQQYSIERNWSFMTFLELISCEFKKHTSVAHFDNFLFQIRSSLPQLERSVQSMVDLKSFNLRSLQSYSGLSQSDSIRFHRYKEDSYINGEESDYLYTYTIPATAEEDKSVDFSGIKTIDSQQIHRLQIKTKLVLLRKSEKNLDDDELMEKIEAVHQMVQITEKIKGKLKKASRWCKKLPNKVVKSSRESILQDLKQFYDKLKAIIDQSKNLLLKQSQQYPFFNWIEEHEGRSLIEAIQMNDVKQAQQVIKKMNDKMIILSQLDIDNVSDLHNSSLLPSLQSCFMTMLDFEEYHVIKEIQNPCPDFVVKYIKVDSNDRMRESIIRIGLFHGRVLNSCDLFFCRENTICEQIQLFIMRAITYPGICGSKLQRVFIIANFEQLKPFVAQMTSDLIQTSNNSGLKYNLYILTVAEKSSKEEQKYEFEGINVNIARYISKRTKIFTSEKPGLGKSTRIAQQCKDRNKFWKQIQISNDRKTSSIIKQHSQHFNEYEEYIQRSNLIVEETKESRKTEVQEKGAIKKLAFSYQISKADQTLYSEEKLNRRLFEILILRGIRDEQSNKVFIIPKWVQIYVEISMEMLNWFQNSIFSKLGFKTVHITENQALADFKIFKNHYWNDIKIILDALDDNKKSNRRLQTTTKLKDFAIDMNKDNLQKRIFTSGYYTADAFLRFGFQQHELMKQSAFFNQQLMHEYLRMSLNIQKNQLDQIPNNAQDFRFRCLGLILKSCEHIILEVDALKKEAFKQNRKFDLMSEIQNQNLIFLTQSSSLLTILHNYESYPELIRSFLQKNSDFLLWSELKNLTKKDVMNKLINFCPTNSQNVSEASSILLSLDQSELVFTGHLLGQFVIVYFWLQAYQLTGMLQVVCTDIQSLKNVLWVYSQIMSLQLEFIRLEKTREQDPQLKYVHQEISRIISSRDRSKKSVMICIEEIKVCPNVYPALKDLINTMKDKEVVFIILKDDTNPYKIQDPLDLFYREDQIFMDNFQLYDYELQNHKFVYHFVKAQISEDFKEFHDDLAMIIFKINIQKTISTSLIKPQTQRLLHLINQLCKYPLIFPGNEIANMVKKQQLSVYVQTYSKGKLELILYATIIALNTTYACVTKAGRFWDLVREIFSDYRVDEKNQLYIGFVSSNYEQIIEKFQENITNKLLMINTSGAGQNFSNNQHIYLTKSCYEIVSNTAISIIFKKPLLIIGHSGNSKTMCIGLLQEAIQSMQSKESLGIIKEIDYRFFQYQATSDICEEELNKIIGKVEQLRMKNLGVEVVLFIDNFQISNKDKDYDQKKALLEIIGKQVSFPIIVITSNDELKVDGSLIPNLSQVRLTRLEKRDLINISRKLFISTNSQHDTIIEKLVNWYFKNVKKHCFRNFFVAIEQISILIRRSAAINANDLSKIIYETLKRNFQEFYPGIESSILDMLGAVNPPSGSIGREMILSSVHSDERYTPQILIVENNFQRAINQTVDECINQGISYEIIFDFDQYKKEKLQELMKDLLLKIEEGIFLIIVGFNVLIPYLFSVLDQDQKNSLMKKSFNQVTIGAQSCQLIVHKSFKSVFIVNEECYQQLSPQISGIFETHRLLKSNKTEVNQRVLNSINRWIKQFKMSQSEINQCFAITITSQNFLADLLHSIDKDCTMEEKILENECKKQILRLATFTGIMKLDSLQQSSDANNENSFEDILEPYIKDASHYSLMNCLDQMSSTWASDPFFEGQQHGFNLIVHTLSNHLQIAAYLKHMSLPLYELSWLQDSELLFQQFSSFFQEKIESSVTSQSSYLCFYVDQLEEPLIMKRIQMIQEIERQMRREYKGTTDKNVVIIVKIRENTDSDITLGKKGWPQHTIEKLEGDHIKDFDGLGIFAGEPFKMIQNHSKFLIKNKLMGKLIEKEFQQIKYKHQDQSFTLKRIKAIDKLIKQKKIYNLINNLLHVAFINDKDPIKIGCVPKKSNAITFQQQQLKFAGTKILQKQVSGEYTVSSIFQISQLAQNLSNLIVSSKINPREQIQINLINYLLKPTFQKHMPTVIYFLEKQNFFNKKYFENNQNIENIYLLHSIIAIIFEKEINRDKNNTKVIQELVAFDRLKYPCFQGIDQLIAQHKVYALENTLEQFRDHIFTTYLEFKEIQSLNIDLFIEEFMELYLYNGQQNNNKTHLPLQILIFLNGGEKITSIVDLYHLYYQCENFLQSYTSFVHNYYPQHIDLIISKLQSLPRLDNKEEIYCQALKIICSEEIMFPTKESDCKIWSQKLPIKEFYEIAKQVLGKETCHRDIPEIKILKFMVKYYNYLELLTQSAENEIRQKIFIANSVELKQNFYLDKKSSLSIINKGLNLDDQEETKFNKLEKGHYQVYYEYLKNFKDQESLMFSITFLVEFIQPDALILEGVQICVQKLLNYFIKQFVDPRDLLTRTLDPKLYPNVRDSYQIRDTFNPYDEHQQQMSLYRDFPCLLFLDSLLTSLAFMSFSSPFINELIATLRFRYNDLREPVTDPEYQVSTRNAIIECFENDQLNLRKLSAIARYKQQICDQGIFDWKDCEFLHCIHNNMGSSKKFFDNILGDINKAVTEKTTQIRELERINGVSSLDFDSMFN